MKATVDHGSINISIVSLLEELTPEERFELADALACDDAVFRNVADQIINGWTEMGSHGGKMGGQAEPHTPLDKAIRAVAIGSGAVAKKEIEDMTTTMRRQHAWHEQTSKWAYEMYHAMIDAGLRPSEHPSAYDANPDAYVVVAKAVTP